MKKLLKGIFALVLAASCITSLPVTKVEAEDTVAVVSDKTKIDLTTATGYAYKSDGDGVVNIEASEPIGGFAEGPVEYMLDNNASSIFHSSSDANDWATIPRDNFPVYIVIDFTKAETFNEFVLTNRDENDNKDFVHTYNLYANKTDTHIDSTDVHNSSWTLISSNVDGTAFSAGTANTVSLDDTVTATQVLLEVVATSNIATTTASNSYLTIKDFTLNYAKDVLRTTLDRANWNAESYAYTNAEEYNPSHNTEGDANYLLDGNNSTFWHTDYSASTGGNITTPPYYVVIDLDENGAGTETFNAFSWINRGHNSNDGANGVVENFRFYYTTDDSVTLPLSEAGTADSQNIADAWVNATDLITGKGSDVDYATMKWNDTPASLYTNIFKFSQDITAAKVMVEVLTTKNTTSKKHGCGVEFNLIYDEEPSGVLPKGAYTYFYDGSENDAGNSESSRPSNILDGNATESSKWHSNFEKDGYVEVCNLVNTSNMSVELQKPMYILVNLGEEKTFNQYTYVNRSLSGNTVNGLVTGMNLYANLTATNITISETTGTPISLEGWTKVDTASLNVGSNTMNIGKDITASQVLIEITHVLPNHGGKLTAVCLEFSVDQVEGASGVNIAPGKTVYVSGTGDGNKDNVNDLNTGTKWDSNAIKSNGQDTGDAWIYIDLGSETSYEVNKIVAKFYNKIYPTSWVVEVSDDARTWKAVTDVMTKDNNGATHPVETVEFDSVVARYVRLYFNTINTAASGNGIGVTEFEIYGIEAQENDLLHDVEWDKVPLANNSNMLLDSFYSTMVLNEPDKGTAVAMAENTYARYVSKAVGAVQAQGKTVGETYKLRFVSSVASLNPDAAGFEVSVNGGDVTDVPSNTVFTAIQETDGTAVTTSTAAEVFGNSASRYFTTFTISGVPTDQGNATVTVKPYWIPHGSSEKVYGTTRTFTVSEIMSAAN